jgi:hypothetical protein
VTGGLIRNGVAGVTSVSYGTLKLSGGTSRSRCNTQSAGAGGSVINISGGLLQAPTGAAVYIAQNPALTVTGGTMNGAVFSYNSTAIDVTGGSYTDFASAAASFFAMGSNTINC